MTDYVAVRPAYIGYKPDGSKCVLDDDTGDAITPILVVDANGPVGVQSISRAWADLPTPSAAIAGLEIFCTDYPTSEGTGVLLICTGTRWKPLGNEHAIITQSWAAGLTIAAASAEAIADNITKALPGGMVIPGDSFVVQLLYDNVADAGGANTIFRLRSHTSASILSGQEAFRYTKSSTTFTWGDVDKMSRVLSNTAGRQGGAASASATASTGSSLAVAFADLSAASHIGITHVNGSDTEPATLYYMQVSIRYR